MEQKHPRRVGVRSDQGLHYGQSFCKASSMQGRFQTMKT